MPAPSTPSAEAVENLIIAVLAVNQWSLEKAYSIRAGLAREGLFDLPAIAAAEIDELAGKLAASGYNRGGFLETLLATRLKQLATALSDRGYRVPGDGDGLTSRSEIGDSLMRLKGVGPAVARNYFVLSEGGAAGEANG